MIKKEKRITINKFVVNIIISFHNSIRRIPPELLGDVEESPENITDNFLDEIKNATFLALEHNSDLVDTNTKINIEFQDWGAVGAGFTAGQESTSDNYMIRGSLRGWFMEYIHYLLLNKIDDFLARVMVILVHELTHCHTTKTLSAHKAIAKFRRDKEKSFLLYLAWNLERQHDEGLAVVRQVHTLSKKGYHYQHHHDLRDHTMYMKTNDDYKDEKWAKFWKKVFPKGLHNMRDSVLAYRQRSENFLKSFHLNKSRYEKEEIKGYAFSFAYKHAYYNYSLGVMMCYFIFIANLNDDLDIIDFDTNEQIPKRKVAEKFIAGDNIAVGRIEKRKFRRIFNRIKRLDIFEFYKKYEEACVVLGIPEDYRLLSSKHKEEFFLRKDEIIEWLK